MRRRSGDVRNHNRLTAVLYLLLRDGHISPGRLEDLLDGLVEDGRECTYTNGWLAVYAADLAMRIGVPSTAGKGASP